MKKILLFTFICVLFISCQDDSENINPISQHNNLEKVIGKVTSPTGITIPSTYVYYDDNGTVYNTLTNQLGEFEISVPTGQGVLTIQTGNGRLFRSTKNITVTQGQTLDLRNENFVLNSNSSLAFVAGTYDEIQTIITNLGYQTIELSLDDITNNNLDNINALFLNCSNDSAPITADSFYDNLNDFVINGNSLYTSDWGLKYLVGDSGYAQDCTTERVGGFIADELVCGIRSGAMETLTNNTILNNDLSSFTGTNTIDLEYDLPDWMQLNYIDANYWDVLVEDADSNPLMIKTNTVSTTNDDSIWYSDNGNKVTICHIPPGNPENSHSITISVNALDAHLAHGDTIGDCNGSSGNVYYTTFHNHVGETTNPIIEKIMEYVILNL
ncbi:MAG: hypothetical protein COA88_04280 [Kordia sp.]|nr:MAG: hypothetical protein COA88_04280 [Kordia sp.]